MSVADKEFDYAIVGGGPVGAVMALGLAEQGHRVALVEREAAAQAGTPNNSLGVDPRTIALSLASQTLLAQFNAWPASHIGAFGDMEVWEDRGTSVLRFGAEDVGQSALGHIVEVGPWRAQLWETLATSAVTLLSGVSVTGVNAETAGGYLLTLAANDADSQQSFTVHARMLIAADGANSIVRRELRVPMALTDTGQSALAFAARMSAPHERTAFQRFLAEGPLALLPMADEHLVSVVWSANNERADELAALPIDALQDALTQATEQRLGRVVAALKPVRFPLRQGVINNFAPADDLVFIGDAARVVHPLAGQGVNLGFEDVRALLACTHPDVAGNRLPMASKLRRFARLRRARSRLAVNAMSALSFAYAGQSPAMLWARNTTTRALGGLPVMRRQLVLEAMGLGPVARSS